MLKKVYVKLLYVQFFLSDISDLLYVFLKWCPLPTITHVLSGIKICLKQLFPFFTCAYKEVLIMGLSTLLSAIFIDKKTFWYIMWVLKGI